MTNNRSRRTSARENQISTVRAAVRRRVSRNGRVSSVDLSEVLRSGRLRLSGSRRGSVIRQVFNALISEGVLVRTTETVRNRDTRHQVAVYRQPTARR